MREISVMNDVPVLKKKGFAIYLKLTSFRSKLVSSIISQTHTHQNTSLAHFNISK